MPWQRPNRALRLVGQKEIAMMQIVARLIDLVIAWVEGVLAPAPKLIPVPVPQEAGRKAPRQSRD